MVRLCVIAWFLLTVTLANAIQVTGRGKTVDEAKNNAFANAIDIVVGTIVVNEREAANYRLVKNEILVYSSGYVDDYKILSQDRIGSDIVLQMDVTVSSNKISQRILSKSSSTTVLDGNRSQAQLQTYLQSRNNGDKLLQNLLNDYPYRAFNVEQYPHQIQVDNYRNATLVMPYKLYWNYNYVVSLRETLDALHDGSQGFLKKAPGNVVIMAKDPKDLVLGKRTHHEFNDLTYVNTISDNFYNKELRVMARIIDKNEQTIWYICHHPDFLSGVKPAMYGIGSPNQVVIFGNQVEEGNVRLNINPQSELYRVLNDTFKIQLQIVRAKDC